MIVLQLQDLEKSFGMHTVFKDVSASLKSREKIALLGVNGSGKSTLLKCITGELESDNGEIAKASGLKIGYLQQFQTELQGLTLWETAMQSFEELLRMRKRLNELEYAITQESSEEVMNEYAKVSEHYERDGGYLCETHARKVLLGLGFSEDDFKLLAENLSGGQKTRLRLACTLIREPDLLILDEPTNHLDIVAVEWLESYLRTYNGTLILVSHDRMLVEDVANGIWELRHGRLECYSGNYISYLEQRRLNDLTRKRAYEKQQEYIQKTEEYIRKYKAGIKSKQARGRASILSRLERIQAPEEEKMIRRNRIEMKQESAEEVLVIEELYKAYRPEQPVLQGLDLFIRKGEKVAIVGPNGCGKSTLLKIAAGKLMPDAGKVKIGNRVEIAWFSQEFENLHDDYTLFEEISREFGFDDVDVRSCLGSMLFTEDDVFKKISTLSGGEKGRIALLKLMLTGANFLMMDEPTNHLDLESREIMEHILKEFKGTILLISHDRYFMDEVVHRVVAFENGVLTNFDGNYSYYRDRIAAREEKLVPVQTAGVTEKSNSSAALSREQQKEKARTLKKLMNRNEKLEKEIAAADERKALLEKQMSETEIPLTIDDYSRLNMEYNEINKNLDSLMEEWTEVQIEIESING